MDCVSCLASWRRAISVGQARLLEPKYGGINNLILVGGAMTKYGHGINFLIHLGTLFTSNVPLRLKKGP